METHLAEGCAIPHTRACIQPMVSLSPPLRPASNSGHSAALRQLTLRKWPNLFDHLVGAGEQCWRHSKTKRPRSL
jgi:hypothetical protein